MYVYIVAATPSPTATPSPSPHIRVEFKRDSRNNNIELLCRNVTAGYPSLLANADFWVNSSNNLLNNIMYENYQGQGPNTSALFTLTPQNEGAYSCGVIDRGIASLNSTELTGTILMHRCRYVMCKASKLNTGIYIYIQLDLNIYKTTAMPYLTFPVNSMLYYKQLIISNCYCCHCKVSSMHVVINLKFPTSSFSDRSSQQHVYI